MFQNWVKNLDAASYMSRYYVYLCHLFYLYSSAALYIEKLLNKVHLFMNQRVVKNTTICVISDFRRDVDEICAPLAYYASMNGSSVPTFRENLSVPSSRDFLTFEDGTYRLSRNVCTELPLNAA
jgi:hypothetical protein